jgi:hypothetical protein
MPRATVHHISSSSFSILAPDFHHRSGECIGTTPLPPSALIVAAGFDTAHAVVTVATTAITIAVMILRISCPPS